MTERDCTCYDSVRVGDCPTHGFWLDHQPDTAPTAPWSDGDRAALLAMPDVRASQPTVKRTPLFDAMCADMSGRQRTRMRVLEASRGTQALLESPLVDWPRKRGAL